MNSSFYELIIKGKIMRNFNGKVLFLDRSDINTDEIIPAKYLSEISKQALKPYLLEDIKLDGFTPRIDIEGKSVIITRVNFGCGSSREHAAMEPRHLGVRVVLVKSFARIHETNLKKQGMLGLTFVNKEDYNLVREKDVVDVTALKELQPGKPVEIKLHHADGTSDSFAASHTLNENQIKWLRAGSALNLIKQENK